MLVRPLAHWASLTSLISAPLAAQAGAARVVIILDQESPRFQPLVEATAREISGFFRPGEVELLPPRTGGGTSNGIRAALDQALADSSVAVVVTLGTIGSHLLARSAPSKPSIAGTVIDASWQGIPQKGGSSGVPRLVLCYAQIGGLTVASVITLLLVPVFYSIAVLDLKIIKWVPGK
jgi:hypothetical protein